MRRGVHCSAHKHLHGREVLHVKAGPGIGSLGAPSRPCAWGGLHRGSCCGCNLPVCHEHPVFWSRDCLSSHLVQGCSVRLPCCPAAGALATCPCGACVLAERRAGSRPWGTACCMQRLLGLLHPACLRYKARCRTLLDFDVKQEPSSLVCTASYRRPASAALWLESCAGSPAWLLLDG